MKAIRKLSWLMLLVLLASMVLAACGETEVEVTVEVEKIQTVVETVVQQETVIVAGTPEVREVEVTRLVTEKETVVVEVTQPPPEEPPRRKIVTLAWTQEPDSMNPAYSTMWYSWATHALWNCWPWQYDDTNSAYPHLVTEIPSVENGGVSEDGLVITMHLRDDIVWSDGEPLTSADFVFTYEMIVNPANAVSSQYPYDQLASVEALDERTVVMTFAEPFAAWEPTFWQGLLPEHILAPVFEAEGSIDEAEWNLAPTVGCGPFTFAEWESGSFIRFVRNDNYWLGEPILDEVYLQFVPDDAAQTAACVAGDTDLGFWPPLADVPILQAAGLNLITQASGYNEGWYFNWGRDMASPGARDVNVRQAIAMAIDRTAINADLLLGLTMPAETFWDALPSFVSPDIEPWTYDPDAARQLLEDAGWTDRDDDGIREDADGNKLTLIHGTTIRSIRQDTQAVVQQQLLEVGIDLQILSYDADIFFATFDEGGPAAVGDVDIMEWSDAPYFPDADTAYWLCSEIPDDENPWGGNYFGCDEYLDELFQRQIVTVNAQERQEIFHEISKYVHDQVYFLGMWEDPDIWIVNPRLTGTKFSGVTPFYNIMEWDLTE